MAWFFPVSGTASRWVSAWVDPHVEDEEDEEEEETDVEGRFVAGRGDAAGRDRGDAGIGR